MRKTHDEGGVHVDHLLEVFVTVVDKKNFSRAAETLHKTQSAISLDIKALEKRYGQKLLERTNKYVRLTKAGEILYYHAQQILNHFALVQHLIDDLNHSASGHLSIGSGYTFGEYLLPWIIFKFKTLYPNITPKITIKNSGRISRQVLRQELDLGIIEGEFHHPHLVTRPLAKDEMVLIVSSRHSWFGQHEIDIEQLAKETLILRESGSGTRNVIDRLFLQIGFTPALVMEFGSSQLIKEAVEAGLGISLISKWAIRKEVTLNSLWPLRIRRFPVQRDFSLVMHSSRFNTKVTDLFVDYLSQQMEVLEQELLVL